MGVLGVRPRVVQEVAVITLFEGWVQLDHFAVRYLFGEAWCREFSFSVRLDRRAYEHHFDRLFRARSLDWFQRRAEVA